VPSPRPAPFGATELKTAIVLLDRPLVGPGGYRARGRVPDPVWIDASVTGVRVRCSVSRQAIAFLAGNDAPTWHQLQLHWQSIAVRLEDKIRAGFFELAPAAGVPVVALNLLDFDGKLSRPLPGDVTTL